MAIDFVDTLEDFTWRQLLGSQLESLFLDLQDTTVDVFLSVSLHPKLRRKG